MKKLITRFTFILIFILSFSTFTTRVNASSINTPEKIVYLTFDDGPGGKITTSILDILKQEKVPATFFIIGCQIKGQESTILRMKNEGHSIGLHSVSHKRNKLYCSNESFLEEMLQEQEMLHEITGEKYFILRFPFGCNNNTYKLSQSMVDLLHNNNFRIYDWTTDSGDGANHKSAPQTITKKSCNHKDTNPVVVLMHCSYINKNTAEALPEIIKQYKSEGYTFKTINEDTPEIYKLMKK